jgi:diguanylate cyclase (GGDEF)-like protein
VIKLSAIPRMTIGLVSLAVLLLLVADLALGLFPSEAATKRQINSRVAQGLAMQVAVLLQKRDWSAAEQSLRAVQSASPEVASIGLRRADGRLLVQAGPHPNAWDDGGGALSQSVTVPLLSNGHDWGQLEVAYKPLGLADLPGWLFSGPARLMLMFTLAAGLVYYLYLRRMLEHLDPAAAVPDRVRSAFDSLVEGVLVVDLQGRILLVNKAFEALRPPGDERPMVGLRAQSLLWLQPAEPGTDAAPWLNAVNMGANSRALRFVVRAPGEELPRAHVTLNCSPLHDEQGGLRGCLVSLGDVTELELSHRQLMDVLADLAMSKQELVEKNTALELLANHDMLSGCLNRRAFFELGQALLDRALYDNSPLVCVMADIDHFKRINDTWGHGVGDQAIQRFAELLRQQIRPGDLLGRYGGEEFCLILPGATETRGMSLAETLRQVVACNDGEGLEPGSAVTLSASFGVAMLSKQGARLSDLIELADQAMYVAKKTGRNRVVLAGPQTAVAAAAVAADANGVVSAEAHLAVNAPVQADRLPVLTAVLQQRVVNPVHEEVAPWN